MFTPDTILGWYRKLIAQKYDDSENCSVELLVRGKLVRCMVLFAIDLSTRKVEIICIERLSGLLRSYHRKAA